MTRDELIELAARRRFSSQMAKYPEITWESIDDPVRTKYLRSAEGHLDTIMPLYRKMVIEELAAEWPTTTRDMVSRGHVRDWLLERAEEWTAE